MQEESTAMSENKEPSNVSHQYLEVGREILSKPNLLCDIVESSGIYPVLIFCNTPSDTDFVEIMLKKRGISAQKLIGNVPQDKIDKTFELLKKNELNAIVLTDIAARIIDISDFKLAINYSVPQDSDIYFERAGQGRANSIQRLVTLVSPLELANFHFLKKSLGVEPELAAAPTEESLLKARFLNLKKQALQEAHSKSEALKSVARFILEDADKEEILALLLHNSLNVLPATKTVQAKAEPQDEDFEDDDVQPRQDRWNKRGGRSGGRGENFRSRERGGDRGGYEDRYENDSRDYDSNRNGHEGSEEDSGRQGRRRGRSHDRQTKKDARIYIGKGSEGGITREKIVEILGKSDLSEDAIKHLSIRKNYCFFDIDDEKSAEVIENLKGIEGSSDPKYAAAKAITINAVVEQAEEKETGERTTEDSYEDVGGEREDSLSDEDENFGNR